jgi:Spaetzle
MARSRKIDVDSNCDDRFCLDDPNYPKTYIQSLNLESYKHLFGNDLFEQFSLRIGPEEQGLCQSRKRLIHPKKAKLPNGNWLTIINDEKYQQGILVEECL